MNSNKVKLTPVLVAKEKQYKNTGHDLSDLAQKAIDKIFDKFQPTPTDAPPITTDELINGLENMPDFSGRNADAQGEVMSFAEYFSKHTGQLLPDYRYKKVVIDYAKYYHSTLSQQPEQKADGMMPEYKNYWQLCPKCDGKKYISPDFKGTATMTACNVCSGFGVLTAYKQADKVVDWEKIKEEYIAKWSDETNMPNEYNTFMWFKSRLSTSGVSDGEKLFSGFWARLEMFVKDVKVNDPMSEEEKEMILYHCKQQQK